MHVKSLSFILVLLLLVSSLAGIATITNSSVALGATATGKATPQLKQLDPAFLRYLENQTISGERNQANVQATSGFIPPPVNFTQPTIQSARSLVSYTPSSFDLRTQGKVTAVKSQGTCGACWAFSALASLESFLLPGETRDFSENNMKNLHGYDMTPCEGGNHLMATAYLARWGGPVDETADPYGESDSSSPSTLPVQKHVQDVYFIPDRTSSTDNDNIKYAIQTYGAVSTTMYISGRSPSQYNPATYAYYFAKQPYGGTDPNHSVAIVGWNDTFSRTKFTNQPPGDGAFVVKNEWGSTWGEQGYFYVSYYDAFIGKNMAAYTAQPTSGYNNIYQYDPLGDTESFGEGSNSEWGANVFTAKSSEQLTAVSFYTNGANTQYEGYVYLDPASGPINATGSVEKMQGTTTFPGYHTIPLASSVSLAQGQNFSIVIKFTTPGDTTPLPVETPVPEYSSPKANAGESFYHADDGKQSDGSTWKDMTSFKSDTNICIKAFTRDAGAPETATPIASAPAVSTQDANSLDVFVKGTDNALWWRHWTAAGGWSGWKSLGGYITADPAAVSHGTGTIDVFVRGGNGAPYQLSTTNGGSSWGSWQKLDGALAQGTGPAVTARDAATLDLFVTGTNNALYHKSWQTSGWSAWEKLGGYLTSSPAAGSRSKSAIDVFVRGGNGAPYQISTTDGGTTWSAWANLGGQLFPDTAPAVAARAGGYNVFVTGMNHALYQKSWQNGEWSTWTSLDGYLTSSPAATSRSSGSLDVIVRGGNNGLWQRSWSSSGWSSWKSLGGP